MALNSLRPSDWTRPEQATSEPEFWREWLRQGGQTLGAKCLMLVHPGNDGQSPRPVLRAGEQSREWPASLMQAALTEEPLQAGKAIGGGEFVIRVPWDAEDPSPLLVVGEMKPGIWEETGPDTAWRERALLWASAAGRRRRGRDLANQRRQADELAHALELAESVRRQRDFKAATLETCNQLAVRHRADRVVLGWWREPYVKVAAVSQMNQIEPHMTAVGAVEAAMEEAIEQDVALVWPVPPAGEDEVEPDVVTHQHAALARAQGYPHLCTLPLRDGDRVVGAVTWQRQNQPFAVEDPGSFALVLDGIAPWLVEKERVSGWWGRRVKRAAEAAMLRHWNLQHPWPKLAAGLGAVLLAVLLVVHVPLRVEAEFSLRPEQQRVFSAPFDGFVESIGVAAGDFVAAGAPLLSLDGTALRLEESELLADLSRFEREREQAEAQGDLAAMRVAEAQRDQVRARLQRLRRQIDQTTAVAPYAGFVLDDGNLNERLGAPVRQGDALLRFAQLDGMFFELAVPEADAPLVGAGTPVEIAFRSRPDDVVRATVTRIEPEAVVQGGASVFLVRASPQGALPAWWRPGMTGIGKLITEKRSLLDIFTRRLRDWLRLQLWW